MDIQIPLYQDEKTPEFAVDLPEQEQEAPPSIHMDAMAFGMGCCCLQVTFQVTDVVAYTSRALESSSPWVALEHEASPAPCG